MWRRTVFRSGGFNGGDCEVSVPMQQLNGHGAPPAALVDDTEQIRVAGKDPDYVIVGEAERAFEFVDFEDGESVAGG